jgi:hypothetical protein
VVIKGVRIMRTRPIFYDWSLKFSLHYNEDLINESQLKKAIEDAGAIVGLGDWRPEHGRFLLERFD